MIDRINSAIILSAGIGDRLKPLTDYMPKPLFSIENRPALDGIIDRLKCASIDEFFFNTFHLAEQVEDYLATRSDIEQVVIRERVLRNTGGGIANFRDRLRDRTFIVHNCDVFTGEELSGLLEFHCKQGALVTMMVIDYPGINSVSVDKGRIVNLHDQSGNRTYSGIAVFSPGIWKYIPDDEVFSIIPVLAEALDHGERIAAFDSKAYWCDTGTVERYWGLHKYLSEGKSGAIGEDVTVESSFLKGFNYIGDNAVIRDSELKDCIVFPGMVLEGQKLKKMICHPHVSVVVDER